MVFEQDDKRITTGDLLNNLTAQLYMKNSNLNFTDFVNNLVLEQSFRNNIATIKAAPLFIRNQPNSSYSLCG